MCAPIICRRPGRRRCRKLAYALATAIAVLDAVKASSGMDAAQFGEVVGRISFFVNAGLRFITELCKMRAFAELWDEITATRYGVADPKQRLFRYGVQVNSLGLTEQQPENNVYRILIEMLAVTLSKTPAPARCSCRPGTRRSACRGRGTSNGRCACSRSWPSRPTCWNTAISSPDRPRSRPRSAALKHEARQELDSILGMGGAVAAVETGYMKSQLVESNARRVEAIERGEQIVVGVNRFTETEPSPLDRRRRLDPHGGAGGRGRSDRPARRRGARRATPRR